MGKPIFINKKINQMNRNQTNNKSLSDSAQQKWYFEFLPQDLLLGLNFRSFRLIEQDDSGEEVHSPTLKIELGFLLIKFSYMKVTYQH
tara:strand:+ start:388 stop:651 length:264 start_codon:yes stop_codon:yes gene_type:complete